MTDLADRTRDARRGWARPGSAQDRTFKVAMIVLPSAIGVLAVAMVAAPLLKRGEVSFVLAKDKVEQAPERLKVESATYRGTDDKGHPFALEAGKAVQQSSRDQTVAMNDLAARITLDDGPATVRAPVAQYRMDSDAVAVNGPMTFEAADGYRLSTSDVTIDLKRRNLASNRAVSGSMRLGTFSGGRMAVDMNSRTVTLSGGAHLHIVQGAAKAQR